MIYELENYIEIIIIVWSIEELMKKIIKNKLNVILFPSNAISPVID